MTVEPTVEPAEVERLRRHFQERRADAVPGPDCPPPGRIWSARHGELPTAQVVEVVGHMALCPACAEAWRLAGEFAPAVAREPSRARRGPVWMRRAVSAGVAAAAAVVLGMVVIPGLMAPKPPPAFRDAPAGQALRSTLAADARLPRSAAWLRWESLPEGTRYDVRIATEDLRPLETVNGLTAPEYRVPDTLLAPLPRGTKLLWRVEAVLPDGSRRASATFTHAIE
jgi:hypothetical protein